MNSDVILTWQHFWQALPDIYLAPLITGAVSGALLGFLGVYIVLQRLVFISAALSQVSGLGVALAFFLQIYAGFAIEPVVLALLLSLLTTLVLRSDPSQLGFSRDSLLGLVYVVAAAVTLFLGTRISQEAHDLNSILFGVGVAVRSLDLWLALAAASVILLLHMISLRGMAAVAFDPVSAAVRGLPVKTLQLFLFLSIAVAVAITTRALGSLPVFGLCVLPAMAALVVSQRLVTALVLATLFGLFAGGSGYIYAFFARFPVGASQTVIAGSLVLLAIACKVVVGLFAQGGPPRRWQTLVALGAAVPLVLLALWSPTRPGDNPATSHRATGHTATDHPGPDHAGTDQQRANPSAAQTASEKELDKLKLLQQLQTCDTPEDCSHAAHQLGHIADRDCLKPLLAQVNHQNWGVRSEVLEALGKIGDPTLLEVFRQALEQDANSWVRSTAADALARLHTKPAQQVLLRSVHKERDTEVLAAIKRALQHQEHFFMENGKNKEDGIE